MKNVMNKMKDFLMPQDEYDDEDELEEIEHKSEPVMPKHRTVIQAPIQQPKLVPMGGANGASKMEILNFTMTSYDMTGEVFNYIKSKKPVIVNMQQLNAAEVQRAVDYLTGACYALNGAVERVAENIFVFAPEDVNLSPDSIKQKNTWPII
ncbi:MAG: cell division protein SepF [Cellulosilyticaceae bacterium]